MYAPDLASRLWNADETGFCMSVLCQKVLARRGSREVHETSGGSGREYFTVLGAGAADGARLPPFILYKGSHLYLRWTNGRLAGAVYSTSDSGWMDASNFDQWFGKLFIPSVRHLLSTGPVVLFVDGHHSHLTLQLIQHARRDGIQLFCMPPHVTHVMQPLDVGVYGPIKKEWKAILKEHRLQTLGETVSKEEFPGWNYIQNMLVFTTVFTIHRSHQPFMGAFFEATTFCFWFQSHRVVPCLQRCHITQEARCLLTFPSPTSNKPVKPVSRSAINNNTSYR